MNNNSAHKRRWETGEFYIGLPYLTGIVIHMLFPATIAQGTLLIILKITGICIMFIGLALLARTRREFHVHQQPTDPGQSTGKIITSGPFSFSRNPLYLGGILIFLGLSLAANFLWPLLTLVISVILCHTFLILPEEKYLTEKFGVEYIQYTKSVRRWLGRK